MNDEEKEPSGWFCFVLTIATALAWLSIIYLGAGGPSY